MADGTAMIIKAFATLKSIRCLLKYPMRPDVNPNASVSNATPIAATGLAMKYSGPSNGKIMRNIGRNIAAPPIPPSIAPVATSVDMGNMNQYNE